MSAGRHGSRCSARPRNWRPSPRELAHRDRLDFGSCAQPPARHGFTLASLCRYGVPSGDFGIGVVTKRPLTDGELTAILQAAPEGTLLGDSIRLLALGGMRCEELARMRVGDLQDLRTPLPWVDLKGSKTEAARRSLPIHSGATAIYLRRAEGKAPDAYLLDELRTPPEGSAMERGQPITKHFGRLLARLGIGEKEDGARQGNVDLHSLRRRWVTQAEQAGHPENLIASCVGHQRPGMTFGRYSSGPLLGQLRAVVESVKLPTHTRASAL